MKARGSLVPALAALVLAGSATAGAVQEGPAAETLAFVRQGDIWVAKTDGTGERRCRGRCRPGRC